MRLDAYSKVIYGQKLRMANGFEALIKEITLTSVLYYLQLPWSLELYNSGDVHWIHCVLLYVYRALENSILKRLSTKDDKG